MRKCCLIVVEKLKFQICFVTSENILAYNLRLISHEPEELVAM